MVKNIHLLNGHMLKVHIGIASMRQFQCVSKTYVTEIKETYFEIHHVHWLSSKISNCQSIYIPGRVAQSVTCLATDASLTADPGVACSIPARFPYFRGD